MMTELTTTAVPLGHEQEYALARHPKTAVCQETAQLCVEEFGERLRAAVLTGSLARDEATFIEEGGGWKVLGDAEFLLIFREGMRLPAPAVLAALQERIENRLLHRESACAVTLSAVALGYLRNLPPHIFGYELRTWGQVVFGDREILSLIPAFSITDIPREEGWCLLCNRMIELLEAVSQPEERLGTLSRGLHYRAAKLYLDMATSFLLFRGAYAPSYRERAKRLAFLAESLPSTNDPPFPLRLFSEQVSAFTELKLQKRGFGLTAAPDENTRVEIDFWREIATLARQLWTWELARLSGSKDELTDDQLLEKWTQLQPLNKRLRGWAYALRECGWHRSWRQWSRWLRLAWRTSPRYCVYAAASKMFFCLPDLMRPEKESSQTSRLWETLCSRLPLVGERHPDVEVMNWRRVSLEIATNYHKFVEKTRS